MIIIMVAGGFISMLRSTELLSLNISVVLALLSIRNVMDHHLLLLAVLIVLLFHLLNFFQMPDEFYIGHEQLRLILNLLLLLVNHQEAALYKSVMVQAGARVQFNHCNDWPVLM